MPLVAASNMSPIIFSWRIFFLVAGACLIAWVVSLARAYRDGDKR